MGGQGSCGEDSWIEVGLLSVRSSRVRPSIPRGKIVDCRGCLGVGLCREQANKKARGFHPREPWFVLVSLLVSVDNQKR